MSIQKEPGLFQVTESPSALWGKGQLQDPALDSEHQSPSHKPLVGREG